VGIVIGWIVGLLDCRIVGLSDCWIVGLLDCRIVGLLDCWLYHWMRKYNSIFAEIRQIVPKCYSSSKKTTANHF
jgi:hypothetical protein